MHRDRDVNTALNENFKPPLTLNLMCNLSYFHFVFMKHIVGQTGLIQAKSHNYRVTMRLGSPRNVNVAVNEAGNQNMW